MTNISYLTTLIDIMKTTNMVRYISILGFILTVIFGLLKTGEEGTSVIVVLISLFLFIVAAIKTRILQKR